MSKIAFVRIAEGLGNQMFMYASSYALSKKFNFKLFIDCESGFFKKKNQARGQKYLLNIFNITAPLAKQEFLFNNYIKDIKRKFLKKTDLLRKNKFFLLEKLDSEKKTSFYNFDFTQKFANKIYIEGHFESENYFLDFKKEVLKNFTIKNKFVNCKNKFIPLLKKNNSVSIHVRVHRFTGELNERKDILNINKSNQFTNSSIVYAKKGMDFFKKNSKNPVFFVWSNDINYISNKFKNYNCIFINNNNNIVDDFYLFSLSKHFIVSPSSFHWWGAWLNQNPGKICLRPKNLNPSNNTDFWPTSWIPI